MELSWLISLVLVLHAHICLGKPHDDYYDKHSYKSHDYHVDSYPHIEHGEKHNSDTGYESYNSHGGYASDSHRPRSYSGHSGKTYEVSSYPKPHSHHGYSESHSRKASYPKHHDHGYAEPHSNKRHKRSFGKISDAINKLVDASRDAIANASDVITSKISSTVPAVTVITTDFIEGAAEMTDVTLGVVQELTEDKFVQTNAVDAGLPEIDRMDADLPETDAMKDHSVLEVMEVSDKPKFRKISDAINKLVVASRNAIANATDVITSKISSTVPAVTVITTDFIEGAAQLTDASLGVVHELTEGKSVETDAVDADLPEFDRMDADLPEFDRMDADLPETDAVEDLSGLEVMEVSDKRTFGKISDGINKLVVASRNAIANTSDVITSKISSTVPAVTVITTDFIEGAAELTDVTLGVVQELTEGKSVKTNAVDADLPETDSMDDVTGTDAMEDPSELEVMEVSDE